MVQLASAIYSSSYFVCDVSNYVIVPAVPGSYAEAGPAEFSLKVHNHGWGLQDQQ